jgi:hypothetical protein
MHSSKTLAQAAQIAERIETLQSQLDTLIRGEEPVSEKVRTPRTAPKRRVSSPKKITATAEYTTTTAAPTVATPKVAVGGSQPVAADEGRGTLRPAVVEILNKSKTPMKTAEIYDALVARGYQFTFKEAKKVLGIRLYKMLGVEPLGGGLFQAKS